MTDNTVSPAFQKAIVNIILEKYTDIPDEDVIEHSFSARFLQWGKKCVQWSRTSHFRTVAIVKKLLIAAIIAALMVGSVTAYPIIRDAFIKYFITEHEERISITFDPAQAATAPREIETVYHVNYVPEEYTLMVEDVTPASVVYCWISQNENIVIFNQYLIPENAQDDSSLGLDSNAVRKSVQMGDYMVEVIQNLEMKQLVWTNNAYFFLLEVPLDMPQEEMEHIFHSIRP